MKFAIFQLFNNYSLLFYIAFVKPFFGIKCTALFLDEFSNECMQELGLLLGVVFISDILANAAAQTIIPRLKGMWRAYNEGLDVMGGGDSSGTPAEQEVILEEYDIIMDLVGDYRTTNIQFGYLTFFVSALPILPMIAFVANMFEIRVDGHKLLKEFRCPSAHGASDIGMWHSVFLTYGCIAVISNSGNVDVGISTTIFPQYYTCYFRFLRYHFLIFGFDFWVSQVSSVFRQIIGKGYFILWINSTLFIVNGL